MDEGYSKGVQMSKTLLILRAPNDGRADGSNIPGNSAVAPIGDPAEHVPDQQCLRKEPMGVGAGDLAHLGTWGLAR
jgi:hypothetical protein